MQGIQAVVLGSPTSIRARSRILHFGLPPARPVSRMLRTPRSARQANGGNCSTHAPRRRAGSRPEAASATSRPTRWKQSVQVEKNSMRVPAKGIRIGERRPPAPGTGAGPAGDTLPTDLQYPPRLAGIRRSSTLFDDLAAAPERRTLTSSGAPASGQVGLAKACNCCVRMTCSLTRPGHPGPAAMGSVARAESTADMLPSPPARRYPPAIAASGARPICPLPTQQRIARRLFADDGTPTPSPFTRAQPAA